MSDVPPVVDPLFEQTFLEVAQRFTKEQENAADELRKQFLKKRFRYALLQAYCQSGKTGTYHALIQRMLRDGDVTAVYILCGSSETELRDQAREDALKYNEKYYLDGTIKILFRQDFKSASMNLTNALIIVDESHLDIKENQQLHIFLKQHGLSLNGNRTVLDRHNAYILSVDATPYAELASIKHQETVYARNKIVVNLQPGAGYFGLEQYLYSRCLHANSRRLHATFDIITNQDRFRSLLSENPNKWVLMRLSSSAKSLAVELCIKTIAHSVGAKILYFDSKHTQVAVTRKSQEEHNVSVARDEEKIPCLEDVPSCTTIVIIKGRLRAGKVVPKKHIGFVWEGSKAPKTDVIVQGLLGRMCGYESQGAGLAHVYVPVSFLERKETKVLKMSEAQRAIDAGATVLPRNATNLKASTLAGVRDGVLKQQCVPIRLVKKDGEVWPSTDYNENFSRSHTTEYQNQKNIAYHYLRNNPQVISENPHLTEEQKEELLEALYIEEPSMRNLNSENPDSSQLKWLSEVIRCYNAGEHVKENVTGDKHFNLAIVYEGVASLVPGANHKHMWLICYTKAHGPLGSTTVPFDNRYAHTNKQTIFTSADSSFDEPPVAASVVGLTKAALTSKTVFATSLKQIVSESLTSVEGIVRAREISSVDEKWQMPKKEFWYSSPKRGENEIWRLCALLERDLNIKMDVKFGKPSGSHIVLKSITWSRNA